MPPFVISDRLYKVGVEFLAMFFLPVVISLIDRYYELVRILQKMCQYLSFTIHADYSKFFSLNPFQVVHCHGSVRLIPILSIPKFPIQFLCQGDHDGFILGGILK